METDNCNKYPENPESCLRACTKLNGIQEADLSTLYLHELWYRMSVSEKIDLAELILTGLVAIKYPNDPSGNFRRIFNPDTY